MYIHLYIIVQRQFCGEYNDCEKAIREALGQQIYTSHLFRFPGGFKGGVYADLKEQAAELLSQNGILHIDWNCLSDDSAGAKTKEALVNRIKETSEGKNNLVILMHDSADKILTYETLQEVIDYLRGEGYTFKSFYDVIV